MVDNSHQTNRLVLAAQLLTWTSPTLPADAGGAVKHLHHAAGHPGPEAMGSPTGGR